MAAALADHLDGQVLLVSSPSNDAVLSYTVGGWTAPVEVPKARGISVSPLEIAVAGQSRVEVFRGGDGGRALTLWTPDIAMHQLQHYDGGLLVTNPRDSRVDILDGFSQLHKHWAAPWVTDPAAGDYRTYVNGLSWPYVTILGAHDREGAFRDNPHDGQLYDVDEDKVAMTGLTMPHSPVIADGGAVFVLDSGRRHLLHLAGGAVDVVAELHGFARGLALLDHLAFVGISQGRDSALAGVASDPMDQPGVAVIDTNTGEQLHFEPLDVREIFDVKLSPVGLHG